VSGRLIFIGLLGFLGLAFLAIILGLYHYLKRKDLSGKSLMEEAVNEETDTTKMGLGEFLVYGSIVLVALLLVLRMMDKVGTGFSNLATAIIMPPVMALFNARKRTGRTIFVFLVVAIISFYMFMIYAIIGVPVKAPVFMVDTTAITMAKTSVGDVLADGFDIYVKTGESSNRSYDNLLSSGEFKKYPADRSLLVKKGFQRNSDVTSQAPYLLVKDGRVLGGLGLYGDKTKDKVLEDCTIIYFSLDEDCIAVARSDDIAYHLDGTDLLLPLKQETLEKTFGQKLWLVPPSEPIDSTQLHYGIQWSTGSDHLFWNEYYAYIHFDEGNHMTGFELSTEIARDWDE